MGQKYTEEMKEKILQMRADGKTYKQIGDHFNRSPNAIGAFVYHLTTRSKLKKKAEKKAQKNVSVTHKILNHENLELPRSQSRPMLAIVGDRAEVSKTIRELFS
jgi:DNA-binding CsgD family transcriptional regulator